MSSLVSSIATDGPLKLGSEGLEMRALQIALSQAGYRVDITQGEFTADTDYWVKQFQKQHGMVADGIVGPITAAALDNPHSTLIATAQPLTGANGWPHDDTASLIAFYGKPWEDSALIVGVPVPFAMTYEGKPVSHIPFHRKAATALQSALAAIALASNTNPGVLKHVSNWSGAGNYRPVRGSSRLSTHAFWAANDFDAEHLPLGHGVPETEMPQAVVTAFKSTGAFWGGDYNGRKDPMHFQYAHE